MSESLGTIGFGNSTSPQDWASAPNGVIQIVGSANDTNFAHDNVNQTQTRDRDQGYVVSSFPSDLQSVSALSVRLRYACSATPGLVTWDVLSARVMSGSTVLAAANSSGDFQTVATSITNTAFVTSSVVNFSWVNTSASKSLWDSAHIEMRISTTRSKGGQTYQRRVSAGELTGTYVADIPPSTVETNFLSVSTSFYNPLVKQSQNLNVNFLNIETNLFNPTVFSVLQIVDSIKLFLTQNVLSPTVLFDQFVDSLPLDVLTQFFLPETQVAGVHVEIPVVNVNQNFFNPTVLTGARSLQTDFFFVDTNFYFPIVDFEWSVDISNVELEVIYEMAAYTTVLADFVFEPLDVYLPDVEQAQVVDSGKFVFVINLNNAGVVVGSVDVSPGFLDSQVMLFGPTVETGSVALTPLFLNQNIEFYISSIVAGQVQLGTEFVSVDSLFFDPEILTGVVEVSGLKTGVNVQIFNPVLTVGEVDVVLNFLFIPTDLNVHNIGIDFSTQFLHINQFLYAPNVFQHIETDFVSVEVDLYDPSLLTLVGLDLLSIQVFVYQHDLAVGSVDVDAFVLEVDFFVYQPVLLVGEIYFETIKLGLDFISFNPSLVVGEIELLPLRLGIEDEIYAPEVGTFTHVDAEVLISGYQAFIPEVAAGAVNVETEFMNVVYSIHEPLDTIVGSVSIFSDFLNVNLIDFSHTVLTGVVSAEVNLLIEETQVFNPTVAVGVVEAHPAPLQQGVFLGEPQLVHVQPVPFIYQQIFKHEPFVSPGFVEINVGVALISVELFTPSLTPGNVDVYPNYYQFNFTVSNPEITIGEVQIHPGFIQDSNIYDPSLKLDVRASVLNLSLNVYDPSVVVGEVYVSTNFLHQVPFVGQHYVGAFVLVWVPYVSIGFVAEPLVEAGSVNIENFYLDVDYFINGPQVSAGPLYVGSDFVDLNILILEPSVEAGFVVVEFDYLGFNFEIRQPYLLPVVDAGYLHVASLFYGPNITSQNFTEVEYLNVSLWTYSFDVTVAGVQVFADFYKFDFNLNESTISPGVKFVNCDYLDASIDLFTHDIETYSFVESQFLNIGLTVPGPLLVSEYFVTSEPLEVVYSIFDPNLIVLSALVEAAFFEFDYNIYSHTVLAGASGVSVPYVQFDFSSYGPAVDVGTVFVDVNSLVVDENIFQPATSASISVFSEFLNQDVYVYLNAISTVAVIAIDFNSFEVSVFDPTLEPGSVLVDADYLIQTLEVFTPEDVKEQALLFVDKVELSAGFYEPEILVGEVSVESNYFKFDSYFYDPKIVYVVEVLDFFVGVNVGQPSLEALNFIFASKQSFDFNIFEPLLASESEVGHVFLNVEANIFNPFIVSAFIENEYHLISVQISDPYIETLLELQHAFLDVEVSLFNPQVTHVSVKKVRVQLNPRVAEIYQNVEVSSVNVSVSVRGIIVDVEVLDIEQNVSIIRTEFDNRENMEALDLV